MNGRDYTRFLLLSSPRSGTHMLRTALNRHANIVSLAEMFNPDLIEKELYDVSTPATAILREHIFREYPPEIAAVGFILHRGGAPIGRWEGIWPELEADLALRVILLHRHDLLRRFLSHCIMRERRRSGRGDFVPEPRRYEPSELQAEFERYEGELAGFRRRFADHPMLQVSYEELCSDYDATIARIELFLGVGQRPLTPGTRRNPPRPAERLVTNFDELAAAFARSRWAWFFRRDPGIEPLAGDASGTVNLT
jgi:hypothetical protein